MHKLGRSDLYFFASLRETSAMVGETMEIFMAADSQIIIATNARIMGQAIVVLWPLIAGHYRDDLCSFAFLRETFGMAGKIRWRYLLPQMRRL
jgi:hypothetical protein